MHAHAHALRDRFTNTRKHKHTQAHMAEYQALIYIHITQEWQNAAKTQKRENSICVGFKMKYLSLVSVNYL